MLPVTTPNIASGTIHGLGNLGNKTVGLNSLTGQYHFGVGDINTTYLSVGLSYMHVIGTEDGVVTDLEDNSAFGTVLQVGIDIAVAEHVSVFADLKQYFISTMKSSTMGVPITANARVDPIVVSTGIGISF